jgi:hypothetical protein
VDKTKNILGIKKSDKQINTIPVNNLQNHNNPNSNINDYIDANINNPNMYSSYTTPNSVNPQPNNLPGLNEILDQEPNPYPTFK